MVQSRLKWKHSEPPIAPAPAPGANGVDERLKRRPQGSRQLACKPFIKRNRANQFLNVGNVLGSINVLQPADKLDRDEVLEADHAYAVDDRCSLNLMPRILGSDRMNANTIENVLAARRAPFRSGGFELIGSQPTVNGIEVEVNSRPQVPVQKDGDAAHDRCVNVIA